MKQRLLSASLCVLMVTPAFAAKGPEIDLVDNKLSVDAEMVPLSRLLRLLDLATGMKSKVPPELANRNVSVKFSGLSLNDGIRKIFQGQPFDYAVLAGESVIVTAPSQNITGNETLPAYSASPTPETPFVQEFQQQQIQPVPGQPGVAGQPQQPAMIQTPFGNLPNPRAPQQPATPLSAPGQNTLFPNSNPNPFAQQAQPGVPANGQPTNSPFGTPNAFGAPGTIGSSSPFGTPQPQQGNPPSLFGSQPSVFANPQQHNP
jgi:hypothetical protein